MKGCLSLTLGLLVVLLLAGDANAAQLVIITLDEFGTALETTNGVTFRPAGGRPIVGGGVAYPWEGVWGIGGDIVTGSLLLLDGHGNVSDTVIFDNLGPVSFYSDGTDGLDSPADRPPPLPVIFPFPVQILETGPEGNNGAFYFAPVLSGQPGSSRQYYILYRFISDGRIVPEPANLVLLVSGFVVLAGMAWRRHRRN